MSNVLNPNSQPLPVQLGRESARDNCLPPPQQLNRRVTFRNVYLGRFLFLVSHSGCRIIPPNQVGVAYVASRPVPWRQITQRK